MKRTATAALPPANGTAADAPIPLQPQRSHVLLVVFCITLLGVTCIISGSYLIMHNHESGGTLLISTGGSGTITGLIGLLSMSKQTPAPTTGATATATATAPKPAGKQEG
jgi:hypothetical protein